MSDDALHARSRWETTLYLRATPCPSCGRGPLAASSSDKLQHFPFSSSGSAGTETALRPSESRRLKPAARNTETGNALDETTASQPHAPIGDTHSLRLSLKAVCAACSKSSTWTFTLPISPATGDTDDAPTLAEPSSLLDVGQWVMLSGLLLRDAEREHDNVVARNLKIEAGACLEEALKFYDDEENDLPPQSAIFTDATRERFRLAPQQFSRQRLVGARAKLPNPSAKTRGTGKT